MQLMQVLQQLDMSSHMMVIHCSSLVQRSIADSQSSRDGPLGDREAEGKSVKTQAPHSKSLSTSMLPAASAFLESTTVVNSRDNQGGAPQKRSIPGFIWVRIPNGNSG